MAIDPAFGVNNFETAKYYDETQTIANNIMMLLQGRPGFFPSIPTLGMNIRQLLYKPIDEIDTTALKVELVKQCSEFITQVRDGTFDVQIALVHNRPLIVFIIPVTISKADQQLAIGVSTNSKGETVYKITYVDDDDSLYS